MNNCRKHLLSKLLICVGIALCIVASVEAVESITTPDGVYGHPDTPKLQWCDYIKHDAHRPLPKSVETGTKNVSVEPPSDAEVLFLGKDMSAWNASDWKFSDGVTIAGKDNLTSRKSYGDCQLHLEFMVPDELPKVLGDRGNSGVILMGRYEVQIFDSHPSHKLQIYSDGQCAAVYGETPPLVNACRKPGQWQSFDIIFSSPVFKDGKLLKPATVTMLHNGVLVHLNTIIYGPVGWREILEYQPHAEKLPLKLQGHSSPVRFRNVWIRPLNNLARNLLHNKPGLPNTSWQGPEDILTNEFYAMDTATKDPQHQTAAQQVEMIKELGYDGLGYWQGSGGLAAVLEELDKHELKAYPVYLSVRLDDNGPPYDANLKQTIELLKDRPGAMIWLPVYSKTYKKSSTKGDQRAVEILRQVADMCEKANVKIALYPHYGAWLETIDDAIRITKKVNRENLGLTFNLCHWLHEDKGELEPVLKKIMPYLFAVTINGADEGGKDWKQLIQPLGSGTYDSFQVIRILHKLDYTGPIGFQGFGIGGDVYSNLQQTMNTWKQYKNKIAHPENE
jgi:sugar phosphate isomerase/epimerase